MAAARFLLIKAYSYNLWRDIDHVLTQLLIAEITGRIPIVYWPTHCLYNGEVHTNAFELYFEPVSKYTIFDLARKEYTYWPPIWNSANLLVEDYSKEKWAYRNIGSILCSNANVVVGDVYYFMNEVLPFVKKSNPAYGMTGEQAYKYLYGKYIKIKPDIKAEIQEFYNAHLKDGHPLLAVHVRKANKGMTIDTRKYKQKRESLNKYSIKYRGMPVLDLKRRIIPLAIGKGAVYEANSAYRAEIRKFMDKFGIGKIFLLTDCEEVLREYKERYGNKLFATTCERLTGDDSEASLENPVVNRDRGVEIIKDVYLAAKCDFFIGNDFSGLSHAVTRLKDWPESNVKLLYFEHGKRKYPVNVKIITEQERFISLKNIARLAKKLLKKIKDTFSSGGGRVGN